MATVQVVDTTSFVREYVQNCAADLCRLVDCTARVIVGFDVIEAERTVWHDRERYVMPLSLDSSPWGVEIKEWLDRLHAPLLAQRQAEEERRRLNDLFPLRIIDPLLGG